jgi:riboflavin biosynthesis pyrimidine reductase
VRRLLPDPADPVDPYEALRPPPGPWVRVDFVTSVDGTVTDAEGRSGGLGGPGDKVVFSALRAHADVVLVGAGTARAEGYGPHRPTAANRARRRADGRAETAAIAVVSGSLELDPDAPLFTQAQVPTVVVTHAAAPADRRAALERAGRVLVAGRDRVDLGEALRGLRALGLASVVCEGGPVLAGTLFTAGLADELCLTLAPTVTGRGGPRLVERLEKEVPMALSRVLEQDNELYLGYEVRR